MRQTGKGKKPDAIGIITAFLAFVTLFSFSVIITDYYILKLYATEEERKQLTNILVATESKETSSQISASANKYREIEKPVIENLQFLDKFFFLTFHYSFITYFIYLKNPEIK